MESIVVISSSDSEEDTPVSVHNTEPTVQLYSLVGFPPFGDAWVLGRVRPKVYKVRLAWGDAYAREEDLIEPSQEVLFRYPENERGAVTMTKADLLRLQPGMCVN